MPDDMIFFAEKQPSTADERTETLLVVLPPAVWALFADVNAGTYNVKYVDEAGKVQGESFRRPSRARYVQRGGLRDIVEVEFDL